MKLVIFGLTISSSWGNGHATLWRGLLRALARRGHQIVFFERDVPYYRQHRDQAEFDGVDLRLYENWEDARQEAARALVDADIGIVTSYCPDAIAASRLVLDAPVRVRCFYDLDTPVTLATLDAGGLVEYIAPEGLSGFDLVLSYTGGAALDALQQRLGARRVAPLYGSVDPDVHHPVPAIEDWRNDLSYLGTYAADRQEVLEQLFIEPARQLPERRFLIGGAQYPAEFPWADNILFAWHVAPGDHPAFYGSSRLTLNITRRAMAAMGYCPSGRLFEAAACGVPILSDWWEGLDLFFAPEREILIARSTADTVAALGLSDDELARIARLARERTLDVHTADNRALDFESAIQQTLEPQPPALTHAPGGSTLAEV